MSKQSETHFIACNLCEAICGLEIQTRAKEIISIKGDPDDPLSQGHICPKAVAIQDIYKDPERLRSPVRRTTTGWEPISWDEALQEVAASLQEVQEKQGKDAVGVYRGNPSVHSLGIMMCTKALFKALKTRNCFSATSVDQLPQHIAAGFMFGHELMVPVPDVDRTEHLVILGANPVVSNGSMMTAPKIGKRLKAIQARGGRIVVIDPRFSETAELANQHFFIQPGSDAHLLAAMTSVLFQENLVNPNALKGLAEGLDDLQSLLSPWSPENVEVLTGISALAIRKLVRDFCLADSAVLYGRMGISTQEFGTLCQWLITVFNLLTGNLDKAGGAMFTTPALDVLVKRQEKHPEKKSHFVFDRYRSRVKSLPEMQGEFPVTTMADEMLVDGDGQIKAMLVVAGNPVLSTPNGRRLSKAFEALDFMVAVDFYVNETSRHANIILPPTTILERDHYDLVFHLFAVRNTARFSPAIFKAEKNARSDAEILLELAARLSSRKAKSGFLKQWKIKYFIKYGARKILDLGLKKGPYGKSRGLSLKSLEAAKHGLDFGPLKQALPHRLFNKNKQIELTPAQIISDLPRLQSQLAQTVTFSNNGSNRRFDLLLIGRRDPRSCNSWMHNSQHLTKGKERCVAHIHPNDVQRLKLQISFPIRVSSDSGEIDIEFVVTDTIKQGVISIPHGWGHNLPGVIMSCAVANSGVSVNDLTLSEYYDQLSGNAALNGVPVKVESVKVAERPVEHTAIKIQSG